MKLDMTVKFSLPEQKMKFSIRDFFSKCDQIRNFLRIWSHLLKKYLMEKLLWVVLKMFVLIKKSIFISYTIVFVTEYLSNYVIPVYYWFKTIWLLCQ